MTNEEKAIEIAIEVAMCNFPTHETADAESMRIGAEFIYKQKTKDNEEFNG